MLEVFKSRVMILFMMIVIGVIFIDCSFNDNLDESSSNESLIVLNS